MNADRDHRDQPLPEHDSDVAEATDAVTDADEEEDEEIPFGLMVALIVLAVVIAVVYLTIGGGHNHFH